MSLTRLTGPSSRAVVAEQIAVAASNLARTARANDFPELAGLIEAAVLEAWREASEPEPIEQPRSAGRSVD